MSLTFYFFYSNLQTCEIDKLILTKQFTLYADYNQVNEKDREDLIDPTFAQKIEKDVEDHLLILVNKDNFNVSLKFISDFYNDTTKCDDLEASLNGDNKVKTYLITMRVKDNEIYRLFTTLIPSVNFNQASFTLENYLVQNLNYNLNNSNISTTVDISGELRPYDAQHVIIFTDDYSYLQKLNSGALNKDNRTVDYILYMTSSDDKTVETVKKNLYKDDSAKAAFHVMTPKSKENVFGENTCKFIKRDVPFKWQLWHFILIGTGIFAIVVGFVVFYHKCIRPKNLYVEIIKNIPSGENKEELSKGCDEFYIPEGNIKINFKLVKGRGHSSAVYEATIKRALLSALPRKSFDHNSISEDYVVAAKLLKYPQQDQIPPSDFYGEINAARKLGKHDKICTLLENL
uniref:Uncharacterized protein n=1 Tax=Panagrolaimus davidi TaxID=227884 RepID=A0A914PBQ1_9BILA